MKRIFNLGKIDYAGCGRKVNLVTVEVEYKEKADGKKCFSAYGNIWNASQTDLVYCGQCFDEIAKYVKTPLFKTIYNLWKEYHLNDMHPECEHQAAEGWRQKAKEEVTLYHWRMTREARAEQKSAEKAAIIALKCGKIFKSTIKQGSIPNSV